MQIWQDGSIAFPTIGIEDATDIPSAKLLSDAVLNSHSTASKVRGYSLVVDRDTSYDSSEEEESEKHSRSKSMVSQKSGLRSKRRGRFCKLGKGYSDIPSSENSGRTHGGGGLFKHAAVQVLLAEQRLMSTGEITRLALKYGLVKCTGKTPEATMASALYTDIKRKGDESLFIRPSEGLFGLRKWLLEGNGILHNDGKDTYNYHGADNKLKNDKSSEDFADCTTSVLNPECVSNIDESPMGAPVIVSNISRNESANQLISHAADTENKSTRPALCIRTKVKRKCAPNEDELQEDSRRFSSSPEAPSTNRLMELLRAAEKAMTSDSDVQNDDGLLLGSESGCKVNIETTKDFSVHENGNQSSEACEVRSSIFNEIDDIQKLKTSSLENLERSNTEEFDDIVTLANAISSNSELKMNISNQDKEHCEPSRDENLLQNGCLYDNNKSENESNADEVSTKGIEYWDIDKWIEALKTNLLKSSLWENEKLDQIPVLHGSCMSDSRSSSHVFEEIESFLRELEVKYGLVHPIPVRARLYFAQVCLMQSPAPSKFSDQIKLALERASEAIQESGVSYRINGMVPNKAVSQSDMSTLEMKTNGLDSAQISSMAANVLVTD